MNSRQLAPIASVLITLLLVHLPLTSLGDEAAERPVPIRIGWQMSAVTQAGITQVLKRTDVLAQHGLEANLVPFSFGTPEVEAAFEGKLDAFFAGDQPAINLMAMGGKWKIVGRLFYDRISIIVPPGSPIERVEDLKGTKVASPFGSSGHREAVLAQTAAGLDADREVSNIDMDILEIRRRVLGGGVESWDGIAAAAIWEPGNSEFRLAGLTRNLTETHALGVIALSDEFITKHPEAAVEFLVALMRAWYFFVDDPARVMRWYNDDTQLDYDPEFLLAAIDIDPNFDAKVLQDIDLRLGEEDLAVLERNAAWGVDDWEDGSRIRPFVDLELMEKASRIAATTEYGNLKVILPSIRAVGSGKKYGRFSLDRVPLFLMFLFMVLVAMLAIELGLWLGKRGRDEKSYELGRPIGTVAGAVLGMMAFVIALTLGSATNRFDARKAALLDDVIAIRTAYLQTSLLPEPHRTTLRSLLRDYVQARAGFVHAYGEPETLDLVLRHTLVLTELMWDHIEVMVEECGPSGPQGNFASALNQMFDLNTKRIALGVHYRIPGFFWWAILFASAVAMVAVGFQFGLASGRRIMTTNLALALTFALVIMLAFDLDRAGEGLIEVNQQPMIDLYQNMRTWR